MAIRTCIAALLMLFLIAAPSFAQSNTRSGEKSVLADDQKEDPAGKQEKQNDDAAKSDAKEQANGQTNQQQEQQSEGPSLDRQYNLKPIADFSLDKRVAELEKRLSHVEGLLESQSGKLDKLAEAWQAIAKTVEQGRTETARPVDPPQPEFGKLVIENFRDAVYMNINGSPFIIGPGRTELRAPFGQVVTELTGYESPKNWKQDQWRKVGNEMQLAIQVK